MNQSLLIMADTVPPNLNETQTIGIEDIDFEKLFNRSKEKRKKKVFLYINKDFESVFKKQLKKIKCIKAAGGAVKNGKGNLLAIYRLKKWDLPKGKLEKGEQSKKAAKREVEEECGISVDYVGKKLITTYHTYQMKNHLILKQTDWYEMGVNKEPVLTPQKEEDITKAIWISKEDFITLKDETYPLIVDVINTV